MTQKETLTCLFEALKQLVDLLRLDKRCQWTTKFERDMEDTLWLLENGFTDKDVSNLSTSIMYVYQGMGSFNDYSPGVFNPKTGRYEKIFGTESFDAVSQRVYDMALKLNEHYA